MEISLKRTFLAAAVAAAALSLAACGGGGGGGGVTPSTPTPTTTQTPLSVTGSGTLVDHETGAAIAGMYVGLAPNTVGATPIPQPTTDANGKFTVTASAAGTYLLVIGDGKNNRPVIHDLVTLNAGANALTAPNIGPAPGATPNPIEQSGNFRLTTLTAMEQNCLAYFNQVRTAHSLSTATTDEWLTEDNRAYWMVATATNSFPQYSKALGYNDSDGNGADCKSMIDNSFALNVWVTFPQVIWYEGDAGGAHNVAASEGMADPRGALPTPAPANPWP